ncbi:MAG: hypothetical protein LBL59_09590 [Xanthomonadaceae bacterium]|nr:hypothetical protein [Xanthomonadaceae bacterium]
MKLMIIVASFGFMVTAQALAQPGIDAQQRDRQSILALQGEYGVDSSYEETVLLKPGYDRAAPQRERGSEWIAVAEDRPTRVVLQHLHVDDGGVVSKGEREDWDYEAGQQFEYSAERTWRTQAVPADKSQGSWTRCVYDAAEVPLHCSVGRWNYNNGIATWTGDVSWRPLPARDAGRSDYNALRVLNRYTLTPSGWTHEQFNAKVLRRLDGGQEEIAREFGLTDYRKADSAAFSAARAYWDATQGYWAQVRARWSTLLSQPPGVRLKSARDAAALAAALSRQADQVRQGKTVGERDINRELGRRVETVSASRRRR